MKKILQVISLFLLFFLLFCFLFSLFGIAEMIEHSISGGKSIVFSFSALLKTILQRLVFHLTLILFLTSLFTWFFCFQKGSHCSFIYTLPFFFSLISLFGFYSFLSNDYLVSVRSPHCESCVFGNLNPDYEYQILNQEKIQPKGLEKMHLFSEEMNRLIVRYKEKSFSFFLFFCFSVVLLNASFWFYSGITSWPFLNFLLLLFVYTIYFSSSRVLWGDLNLFLVSLLKKDTTGSLALLVLPFEFIAFALVNFSMMIPLFQKHKQRRDYGS